MKTVKKGLPFVVAVALTACSDFLDPKTDNTMTEEEVFSNAAYFAGPLMDAYNGIADIYDIAMDNMTDNSVDSHFSGDYYLCGTGALRPNNNPLNNWVGGYRQIRRLNQFLSRMVLDTTAVIPTPVRFYVIKTPQDSIDNVREFYRLLGEAYFVRAYWKWELLQNFGGIAADGITALGVPEVGDRVLEVTDNLNLPRATYAESVQSIVNDCDTAAKLLPVEYKGSDKVTGEQMNGRASGIAAMALKARVLLYAASPAFNPSGDITLWEKAAIAAGEAIKAVGGLANLSTVNNYYFLQLNNGVYQHRDIIFRSKLRTGNRLYENNNYPQSMYGSATTNPSQNYVDAFPDKNGYPISESTLYQEDNPYVDRDPRLALYVAYNGSPMGPSGYHTIASYKGGEDAWSVLRNSSRTSCYLKKLLRTDHITLVPGSETGTPRARIVLGMPELYLNFAEAANEAWGVKGDPMSFGFTAATVLQRIHQRYSAGNVYLNSVINTDAGLFRTYIRNERRIELAFEGHYYYDLRRWIADKSTATLNVEVYGMEITQNDDSSFSYNPRVLMEKRSFSSPFQPIPYMEIYNSPALVQNYGW
ncbi:MAG: RagB/SusD family nutrient uptake outer membrane protein [Bacteroidales bacterium]|nr:RagB/SusD family nutrient uptake outer membrane protein [Bacteroidales bacterium]